MRTTSTSKCSQKFPSLSSSENSLICANSVEQSSVCPGDSGTPLVTEDSSELVGISCSISPIGCDKGLPQGFIRVSAHLGWIKEFTGISCKK